MRSKELSLCITEEIKKELKKRGVIDVRWISIKKEDKMIGTNTYVMTFKSSKIPVKIKVGHTMQRVKQFVCNPFEML